jgi:hypothetical protein
MTSNKTTYTLELDAEVGHLKGKLENAKNALDKLNGSTFAVGLEKKFNTILN